MSATARNLPLKRLKFEPACFKRRNGNDALAAGRNCHGHAGQEIHPTFRRKLHLAEVGQARHHPGVVCRKDVEAGVAFLEHHRKHLFGTRGQRCKGFFVAARFAGGLIFQPFANAFVKTFAQYLGVLVVILNKVFCETVQFFYRRIFDAAALAYKFGGLHAAPYRARKEADVAFGRNALSKRLRLLAATVRKAYMRTEVRVVGCNVVTFTVTHQQEYAFIRRKGRKEICGFYKIIHF